MASIRKRCGKWQVQVRRHGSQALSRTFVKKSDAQEWARQMEAKADRHDLGPSQKLRAHYKVRDILERYKKEITVKKKGRIQEERIIAYLSKQPFSALSLDVLNESHICRFRDKRLEQVKPATFMREIAVLQHALETAQKEWGLPLRSNPVKVIKKPKVINARDRRLEDNELQFLLDKAQTCRNIYIEPIILFAIETGMRQSEILNAKWIHFDEQKGILHIPITKSGYDRNIPLTKKAILLLQRLEEKGEYIFPISPNALRLGWKRLIKRTSIINLRFHDLRHEAISRFFEMGLSIPEVALISGHRDYKMLFRYTHIKIDTILEKLH